MQGARICIIGILITTFSFTQVEMSIQDVDTDAGTLNIYMKNVAGCSYCTDSQYDNEEDCLISGSTNNDGVIDGTWAFDSTIPDGATCSGQCTNSLGDVSQFESEVPCEQLTGGPNGTCSVSSEDTNVKKRCEEFGTCSGADTESIYLDDCADASKNGGVGTFASAGYTWENNLWVPSAKNGFWFSGEVGGFQFQLTNINVTDASGGIADDHGWSVDVIGTEVSSGISKVQGYTITGNNIQASDGILTQITFTELNGTEVCFGAVSDCAEMTGAAGLNANIISDKSGLCVGGTSWTCECLITGEENLGCGCGEGGPSGCDNVCGSTAVVDCLDICGGTAVVDCLGVCGGTAGDSDDDGNCLAISQIRSNLPDEFSISHNYPNPFNPVTAINFDVAEMDEISLIVYDLAGKEVATLVSGIYAPGRYMVEWNAVNNAGDGIVSGMYIYRYISSEQAITRKMLYLK